MAKQKKRLEKKVTIDGKRISVYGFTALEIQQKIEELEKSADRKKYPLFSDVLEMWQDEHFDNIAVGTQVCYKPAIRRALAELGSLRLCDITPMDITALLKSLASLGYSAQTVKVQRIVISLVYDFAQSRNLVQFNPAKHAELPKKLPKKPREIPSDTDIDTVMNSYDQPFGLFAFFLLLTGCRRGEALAIRYSDINFQRKLIRINKNIVYHSNKPVVEEHTKTQAGMRNIVLLDALYEKLYPLSQTNSPDCFVFGKGTTPYTNSEFRRRWQSYIDATGLTLTPHQLRHAYATILYDAKIDEKLAQSFMGHSTIEITRNIYTHIRKSRAAQAQADLNAFISTMT